MSKVSAFNVYRNKNKGNKKEDEALTQDVVDTDATSPTQITTKTKAASVSPPSDENLSKVARSEPRFSSFRKSLRKRSKKDEADALHVGKENKVQKLDKKAAAAERPVSSISLEEQFLPEVIKQRKEQEELHSVPLINDKSPADNCPKLGMYSSSSLDGGGGGGGGSNDKLQHKVSRKRQMMSGEKRTMKRTQSFNDRMSEQQQHRETHDEKMTSGEQLFEWVIAPVTTDRFFSDVWQKKPCFIKRNQRKYNHVWFSTKEFDRILRTQNVQYTKNLDIAVYRDGKRETLNPEGRAFASSVWNFYEEGCSVRLLNPQTFSKNVWRLTSKLQEYFGCFPGTNVYLTPPGSQGFAPHYDDIEAFVIQLEGRKHWRLYPARNESEVLARYSSKNLPQEELGEPILDRILEPGDTLYFPRGVIHQAFTLEDTHSLHITLSCYQKYSWSDYMEKLIPMALQSAVEEDVEFRKGLPIGVHAHVGVANADKMTSERKSFMKKTQELTKKLASYVSVDLAAEELILDQMDEFLPPCLTSEESSCTVFGNGSYWDSGSVVGQTTINTDTHVKITRPGIARIITDDDGTHVHYSVENSREYKELPLKRVEIPIEMAAAAQYLLFSQNNYVKVADVPLETTEAKISLAQQFYDMGLIRTKTPLT